MEVIEKCESLPDDSVLVIGTKESGPESLKTISDKAVQSVIENKTDEIVDKMKSDFYMFLSEPLICQFTNTARAKVKEMVDRAKKLTDYKTIELVIPEKADDVRHSSEVLTRLEPEEEQKPETAFSEEQELIPEGGAIITEEAVFEEEVPQIEMQHCALQDSAKKENEQNRILSTEMEPTVPLGVNGDEQSLLELEKEESIP